MDGTTEITRLLAKIQAGNKDAADLLLPLVYDELRKLAKSRMAKAPPGNTLQPTALVHEAYLRLVGSSTPEWSSRGHFFGAASRAMWHILVEQARAKNALRHGGGQQRVDLDDISFSLAGATPTDPADILALEDAMAELGHEARETQVVLLRYVAGLSTPEIAAALEVSDRTVERDWRFARAFLYQKLQDSAPHALDAFKDPGSPSS